MSKLFEKELGALLELMQEMRPCAEARAVTVWLVRELAGRELGDKQIEDGQIRALLRAVYPGVKGNDPEIAPGWAVICDLLRRISSRMGPGPGTAACA